MRGKLRKLFLRYLALHFANGCQDVIRSFRQISDIYTHAAYVIAHICLSYAGIIYRISRANSRVSSIYAGPLSPVIRAVGSDSRHQYALIPFDLNVPRLTGQSRENICIF